MFDFLAECSFPVLHFYSLLEQIDAIFVTEGVMEKELEANKVELAPNQNGEPAAYDVSMSSIEFSVTCTILLPPASEGWGR